MVTQVRDVRMALRRDPDPFTAGEVGWSGEYAGPGGQRDLLLQQNGSGIVLQNNDYLLRSE